MRDITGIMMYYVSLNIQKEVLLNKHLRNKLRLEYSKNVKAAENG